MAGVLWYAPASLSRKALRVPYAAEGLRLAPTPGPFCCRVRLHLAYAL